MDRDDSLTGRMLAELDADPDAGALRRRGGEAATETEWRAMRGAWVAAVLRALWRAASVGPARLARLAAGGRR